MMIMLAPRYASLEVPPLRDVLLDEVLSSYPKPAKRPDCTLSYDYTEIIRIKELFCDLEKEYQQKL